MDLERGYGLESRPGGVDSARRHDHQIGRIGVQGLLWRHREDLGRDIGGVVAHNPNVKRGVDPQPGQNRAEFDGLGEGQLEGGGRGGEISDHSIGRDRAGGQRA